MKKLSFLALLLTALTFSSILFSCNKDDDEENIVFKTLNPAGEIAETVWRQTPLCILKVM